MHDPGVRVADEAVAPFLESTKRYGVAAFSLVTFLPFMVSPIVKPGPTVPVTVFAVAAELLLVAASAAATAAASSKGRVRLIVFKSLASFDVMSSRSSPGSDRSILEARDGDSHRGDPRTFQSGVGLRRDVVVEVEDVVRVVPPLDLP